jgi:hypothetical protein
MIAKTVLASLAALALTAALALAAVAGAGLRGATAEPRPQAPGTQLVLATDADSGAPVLIDMVKVLYVRREPNRTLITFQSAPPTQIYIREDPADLR